MSFLGDLAACFTVLTGDFCSGNFPIQTFSLFASSENPRTHQQGDFLALPLLEQLEAV